MSQKQYISENRNFINLRFSGLQQMLARFSFVIMSEQQRKYILISAFIKSYQKFIQGRWLNLEMSFWNKFDSDQRIVDGAQVFG